MVVVDRVSTAEQVARGLREMIVSGKLEAGTALREERLAASIGVSRATLREALHELAREGVVKRNRHRGVVVTRLTDEDVVDIFRVRKTIELAAIEASGSATPDQLGALRDSVQQFRRATELDDWTLVVDADITFHKLLVSMLRSSRIDRFYETFQSELRLCLSIVDREEQQPEKLVHEHQELVDALLDGARDRCRALLSRHLDDGEELMKAMVKSQPNPPAGDGARHGWGRRSTEIR